MCHAQFLKLRLEFDDIWHYSVTDMIELYGDKYCHHCFDNSNNDNIKIYIALLVVTSEVLVDTSGWVIGMASYL